MRAAQKLGGGADEFAVHVQGQEVPAHDPRYIPSLAVTYRMDGTPARHTQGGRKWLKGVDFMVDNKGKYDYADTGELQKKAMNMMHVVNAAGLCVFGYSVYPVQYIPDFLTAVTGREHTLDSCLKVGERVATIRHLFNLREGLNPLKFPMNLRIVGIPPLKEGPLEKVTVDEIALVRDYLRAMDWDLATTRPSTKKLRELGLSELAKSL